LAVLIVYILSGIVNKFFFPTGIGAVYQHPHLALFRPDHHRLAAHAPDHVKRIHRPAPKRQLQRVLLDALLQGLSQIVGDLKKPVRRAQPADALVRPPVVVILNPQPAALNRLIEAVKLRPLQKLGENRLPEPLDLAKGHRVVGTRADVPDPVLFHLLLEAGLAPPVGVLPAVVGKHLPRHPVVGHRPPVGLKHVFGRLAAVESQTGDVAAVVVDKADQIGVAPSQPQRHDVALPQLVGPGALEEARLGVVFHRLAAGLLHQPPLGQGLVHCRRAGSHQKKPLEHIGDPPWTVFRMIRLDLYRLGPDLLGHPWLATHRPRGHQPVCSMEPIGLHPSLNRMVADAELLTQHRGAVAFLQEKPHHPQPELHRVGQGPGLPPGGGCGPLGFLFHGDHSFLCKGFLHSGVSPNFLSSAVS
jgi:hypothetical protein